MLVEEGVSIASVVLVVTLHAAVEENGTAKNQGGRDKAYGEVLHRVGVNVVIGGNSPWVDRNAVRASSNTHPQISRVRGIEDEVIEVHDHAAKDPRGVLVWVTTVRQEAGAVTIAVGQHRAINEHKLVRYVHAISEQINVKGEVEAHVTHLLTRLCEAALAIICLALQSLGLEGLVKVGEEVIEIIRRQVDPWESRIEGRSIPKAVLASNLHPNHVYHPKVIARAV